MNSDIPCEFAFPDCSSPSRSEAQTTASCSDESSTSDTVPRNVTGSPTVMTVPSNGSSIVVVGGVPTDTTRLEVHSLPTSSDAIRVTVCVPLLRPLVSKEKEPSTSGFKLCNAPSKSDDISTVKSVLAISTSVANPVNKIASPMAKPAPSSGVVNPQTGMLFSPPTSITTSAVLTLPVVSSTRNSIA